MLEVIIGLIFTYLLLSLLATTLNELIASWRGWRGFFLEEGLKKILEHKDNPKAFDKFKENALFQQLHNSKVFMRVSNAPSYLSSSSFVAIFLRILKGKVTVQELIQQLPPNSNVRVVLDQLKEDTKEKIEDFKVIAETLYEEIMVLLNGTDKVEDKLTAFIKDLPEGSPIQNVFNQFYKEAGGKPEAFKKKVEKWYTELVQVLNGQISVENIINQLPENGKLREVLEQLKEEAGDDLDDFKFRVEEWYLELMDRATGWYKKHMQVVTFLFGFAIAVVFNADTFSIYERLSTNSSARADVVQLANEFVSKNETTDMTGSSGSTYDELKTKVNTLLTEDLADVRNPIGLGWNPPPGQSFLDQTTSEWFQRFLGWLVTALAISLGAPFWFDMLKKTISIRGAGAATKGSQNTTKVVINSNDTEVKKS